MRRTLLTGEEKLNVDAKERLMSSLELGDPHGEMVIVYMIKERLRDLYQLHDINAARTMLFASSTTV